jgi:MFS family permease
MSLAERLTGIPWRQQVPVVLVGIGHGGTHWIAGTFYILVPFITRHLGLSYAEAGLMVAVFHAASGTAAIGSGALIDIFGRQVMFQIGALVVGAAALLAFGATIELVALCVLVALIGATNNLWHPAAISYLSARYPANRGYALSVHALGANLGDSLAPLLAGAALLAFTWQGAAMINAVPAFLAAGAIALVLARDSAPVHGGAHHGMDVGEYVAALARVFRDRAVLWLCLTAGLRTMTQVGLFVFLPLYLIDDVGVGPLMLGFTMTMLQVGGVIAAPIAGTASDRIGRRPVARAGLAASTVLVAVLTLIDNQILFIAGVSLLGFAMFALRPVFHSWMMDLTPPSLGGSATSMMFGTQALLSALTPAVGGLIADRWGLITVFYALAGVLLLANLMVLALPAASPGGKPGETP